MREPEPSSPLAMASAKKSRVVEKYAPLLSRGNSYEDDYDDDDDDSEARRRKVRWAQTEDLTIMAAVRRLGTWGRGGPRSRRCCPGRRATRQRVRPASAPT